MVPTRGRVGVQILELRLIAAQASIRDFFQSGGVKVAAKGPHPDELSAQPGRDRMQGLGLGDQIERLPGVGPKRAEDFHKLGVYTIDDLLTLWPRRHMDRTRVTPICQLVVGEVASVKGIIESASENYGPRSYLRVTVSDGTGYLTATFFHAQWLKRQLLAGRQVLLSGRVDRFRQRIAMTHPEFEMIENGSSPRLGLVPVYPLAGALKQRFVQDLQAQVVPRWSVQVGDPMPGEIRQQEGLVGRTWAILHQHWPDTVQEREESRRRLVFDEFFRMSLAILWLNREDSSVQAGSLNPDNGLTRNFLESLPFNLTPGQTQAWQEIQDDLKKTVPMARLLQGDVGSGKTVIAALVLLAAVGSGHQAALMVPTELLAEQHYLLLSNLLAPLGVPVESVMGRSKRREHFSNEPLIAVGTQALLSDKIDFRRLGAVVIDEQHRFGVRQRARLGEKGLSPHVLVMTATPIPRTLALTIYGDLAISRIQGLPPGRQPITTVHLPMAKRRLAYQRVMQAVRQGHQAYVVCPLVEDNEESQGKAAVLLAEGMAKVPGWRVGLVHGRMSGEEKSRVMDAFRRHRIDVLVGTTILEVGVDVPNATIIVIEQADRFGLAQLHQLRGRVGRGSEPSECYLLADPLTEQGEARLAAMVNTQDGLELAEEDLAIRGPGEVLGMRQHGVAGFQLANPLKDLAWLERSRQVARQLLNEDPELKGYPELRRWVFDALKDALPGRVLH